MRNFYFTSIGLLFTIWINAQNITSAEYFIDSDNGFGQNTSIEINSGGESNNVTLVFNAMLEDITTGMHKLYVRARDENGLWSILSSQLIYVSETKENMNILSAEYYIDEDPGLGNGLSIPVTNPTKDTLLVFSPNLTSISFGMHRLNVRIKSSDNQWSITTSQLFYVIESTPEIKIESFEYYFGSASGNTSIYQFNEFEPSNIVELNESDFLANALELEYGNTYTLYIRALNSNGIHSTYNTLQFTFKYLTSVTNSSFEGYSIYPIPSSDYININGGFTNFNVPLKYFIYNANGKLVSNGSIKGNSSIDIQNLPEGNYIMMLKDGNIIYKGKVLIIK
jgi:hypothetical protein